MASSPSAQAISQADLSNQAGAGTVVVETTPTLALIAADRDTFVAQIVQPLLDGYKKGATEFVLQAEVHRGCSSGAHVKRSWAPMATVQPAMPLGVTPNLTAPATTSSTANDKMPKQLPAQVWQKQIARYNNITIDGRPRRFPEKEVLGAEQILGRIWHEHTATKARLWGIGEILQRRSFTAAGEFNPLQKQSKTSQLLRVQDDVIVQDLDTTFNPLPHERGELNQDSVANRRGGSHPLLRRLDDPKDPCPPQQIRAGQDALGIGWLEDRHGHAIRTVLRRCHNQGTEVMADVDILNEAMGREAPKETKPASKKRLAQDDEGPPPSRQRHGNWGTSSNYKGSKGNQTGKQSGYPTYTANRWKREVGPSKGRKNRAVAIRLWPRPLGTARGRWSQSDGTRPKAQAAFEQVQITNEVAAFHPFVLLWWHRVRKTCDGMVGRTPKMTIAWEVDDGCTKVTKHWFPDIYHRDAWLKMCTRRWSTRSKSATRTISAP